jgi:hypothetical protein
MKAFDHFHAVLLHSDGKREEVEGGFIALHPEWGNMSFLRQEMFLIHMVAAWSDHQKPCNVVRLETFVLGG